MANRIVLNETSYHGAGAIQEIASEAKDTRSRVRDGDLKRLLSAPIRI